MRDFGEMVVVLDAGERIACWNRAAAERFHFESEEAPGGRLQAVYQLCWATAEEQRAAFAEVLGGGVWKGRRTRVLDGEWIDIESAVSALLDTNGECIGRVITVRDLTQRNQSEAAQGEQGNRRRPTSRATAGTGATSICASCKAMRDAGDDWQPADAYVSQRFNVTFMHGMCSECIQRFYPDIEQPRP